MHTLTAHFSASLLGFTQTEPSQIASQLDVNHNTLDWIKAIECLQQQFKTLPHLAGDVILQLALEQERIDSVILYRGIVFVIKFESNSSQHLATNIEQIQTLACKLKQRHKASEKLFIVPILLTLNATPQGCDIVVSEQLVANTICDSGDNFAALIEHLSNQYKADQIVLDDWLA